jgi:Domain of unknown function (DUF4276)
VIEHVVFFLEEPSAQDFLQAILPRILRQGITPHFLVFHGKQDLEKRLLLRLKHWQRPYSQFIVLRDQDSGDCVEIKERLKNLCKDAGKPTAIVRIACRELESFFVGDWAAIAAGYERPNLAANSKLAKYRNPDLLGSPAVDIRRSIPTYQKREGARTIAPHLNLEMNASRSFRVLILAIQNL